MIDISLSVPDDRLEPRLLKPLNKNYREKTTQDAPNCNGLLSNEEVNCGKQVLKGHQVSSNRKQDINDSSDEDTFESRRIGFQQQKYANLDHKGILKVSN